MISWVPLMEKGLKFNANRVATRQPSPASRGVCNGRREVMMFFSKYTGAKDSKKAELLAILEALCMFVRLHQVKLIVESDSPNATVGSHLPVRSPGNFIFILNEIKVLS